MGSICSTTWSLSGPQDDIDYVVNCLNHLAEQKKCWVTQPITCADLMGAFGSEYVSHEVGEANIISYQASAGKLEIFTESQWNNPIDTFVELQQQLPKLEILYMADELEYNYWETNDSEGKRFPDRYYLNCRTEKMEPWFSSKELMLEAARDIIGREVTVDDLKEISETSRDIKFLEVDISSNLLLRMRNLDAFSEACQYGLVKICKSLEIDPQDIDFGTLYEGNELSIRTNTGTVTISLEIGLNVCQAYATHWENHEVDNLNKASHGLCAC